MQMRTTKPNSDNKFYITKSKGGYSTCIQGKPTDKGCNVLANCVGYACGRFNEIIGSMKYLSLNCNAENFIERAKSLGLSISNVPSLGGIMVWQKGKTLNSSDGAGHCAIVERIDSSNQIYTSESNYNGAVFYNSLRKNENGRWGCGASYTFIGCIINPSIGYKPYEEISSAPAELKYNEGNRVKINGVYKSSTSDKKLIPLVKVGTITKRIKNARNPYLLENGNIGWVNDEVIEGLYEEDSVNNSIEKGNKVKVKQGSKSYDGVALASFVFNNVYDVIEINGDRAVIGKNGAVTTAINVNNLIKL